LKKKLLLHICCAPCGLYVFEKLSQEYKVTGFFYNPNIHPLREHRFRKKELERIARIHHWDIVYGNYDMGEWFARIRGFEKEPERGRRCSICFNMRLKKTFEQAEEQGFEAVTSTLSISPYKVTEQINREGLRLSQEFGIEFLLENFKKKDGYNIAKKMACEQGIQHQDYCGCVYSRVEKILKTRLKKTTK
jgi:predicted adenine nucleotide alpha hydrolase (AANH) superfamily ATPase